LPVIDPAGSTGWSHRDRRKSSAQAIQIASIRVKRARERLSARLGAVPSTISTSEVVITMDMLNAIISNQNSGGIGSSSRARFSLSKQPS
jgi:hypothetical protein